MQYIVLHNDYCSLLFFLQRPVRVLRKSEIVLSYNAYTYQASLVFPNARNSCIRSVAPSGVPCRDVYLSQQYCQYVYSPDKTAPV